MIRPAAFAYASTTRAIALMFLGGIPEQPLSLSEPTTVPLLPEENPRPRLFSTPLTHR